MGFFFFDRNSICLLQKIQINKKEKVILNFKIKKDGNDFIINLVIVVIEDFVLKKGILGVDEVQVCL